MNDIENTMEMMMATGDVASEPQTSTTAARVSEMVARYVSKFGSARLQILCLPGCSNDDLRRYLNTLRITLLRKSVLVNYCWQYDPLQGSYLLFLCHYDAYAESVLQIAYRLWHGSSPVQMVSSIHVDQSNLTDTEAWLSQSFTSIPASSITTPFYQHSYGYSRSL